MPATTMYEPASAADISTLREQLDRVPRGVVGIAARCVCGRPTVVVTAPRLEDGTPFPTTFYLTCPPVVRGCSTLEAERTMEELNAWLQEDSDVRSMYEAAHADYIARRSVFGDVPQIAGVSAGGMPTRVKCLHALVAHSLAVGPGINPVGDRVLELLEDRGLWKSTRCSC